MTLIVGNVIDVGFGPLDGKLRVWAWFRPEEVGLIAPYRREWEITGGEIEAGVDVIPGPAAVEIDCGPDAYTTVDVTVPDAESVALKDLFEQVYSYTPGVVSEAWDARRGAEAAAESAEDSAGVALGAERGALAAESGAALSAATLSARVEQSGQDILYTSDGKPYFADPSQIENVPLTVDTSVGTRVFLGDVMIHGDTGVTYSYFDAGRLTLRRVGNLVEAILRLEPSDLESTTQQLGPVIPLGFRPRATMRSLYREGGGIPSLGLTVASPGNITLYGRNGSMSADSMVMVFSTANDWPTSPPGPPA